MYYDNYYLTQFKKYKKYYKIALVLIAGLGLSVMNKNNPNQSIETLSSFNSLVNVMPIDNNAKRFFAPFLDRGTTNIDKNTQMASHCKNNNSNINRLHKPTKKGKRSVSETKKKYVASLQNWQCKHCQQQLSAWFEVDHIKGLEFGGSNDVENLQALCRECHAKKGSLNKLI
tara:strand:+ start:546 stop:1061 length:516 start_codon:yes stop_codon:yes gene_type:complete